LDPAGDFSVKLINADFSYNLITTDDWTLDAQLSYLGTETDAALVPYPAGAFGGIFPKGIQQQFRFRVDQGRAGVTALYDGLLDHWLRFGVGINYAQVNEVDEQRNFIPSPGGLPRPIGRLVKVYDLGTPLFLPEEDRTVVYGFIQDEWRFAPDWTLTAGFRFDQYSDFGNTVNPRFALVWDISPSLTAKLLYGRAFRAPSFTELYGNSAIVALGNPDLKPETLDMVELALSKHWKGGLWTGINVFGYDVDDLIRGETDPLTPASPVRVINTAGIRGHGMEVEVNYPFTTQINLAMNYAYQTAKDKRPNDSPGLVPEHQLYGELNWRLTPGWSLNTHAKWIGDRERQPGGRFGRINDYTLAGITLRRISHQGQWDFSLSVENLLDEEAREPSFYPASLPNDIPLPGRNVTAQFRWRF
jgi:iron complex outermembrane receptor protein